MGNSHRNSFRLSVAHCRGCSLPPPCTPRLAFLCCGWSLGVGGSQVDLTDPLMTEVHAENSIGQGRPQSHLIPMQWVADSKRLPPKRDFSACLDLARDVTRTVLDGRQFLRVLARTGLIALGRHSHGQGFVGPLLIVHIAPAIEAVLGPR